ncbi:MAG: Txe/YoeB family addiction module toxin [Luteolibacter sp.]
MNLEFKPQGYEDMRYWAETNPRKARRILEMIREIMEEPETISPPPELLKNELAGWYSRHIDSKHRLVYRTERERIEIAQVRCHV